MLRETSALLGRRTVGLILAAAVVLPVALAVVQGGGENASGNMGWFHAVEAREVLAGRGFGRSGEGGGAWTADLFLRPTYTLLVLPIVAVFDLSWSLVRPFIAALQGALLGATALAAAAVLARVGAARAAVRLAPWAIVASPLLVSQAAAPVDTTLFAAAMFGAYAFVAAGPESPPLRRWLVAGLILGVAALTRSTALVLVPVIALALWRSASALRARLAAGALLALGVLVVLVPWFVRNHALTGRLLLSTVDGVNLWMGNNENTARFLDADRSFDELPGRARFDSSVMIPVDRQLETCDAARAAAVEFMRAHPGETVMNAARKAGDMWSIVPRPRTTRSTWGGTKTLVSIAWTVPLFASAAAGLVVCFRAGGARRRLARDVLLTCALFTIPHALAWGGTRLRAPLDPFLALPAAVGVAAAWDLVRRRAAA